MSYNPNNPNGQATMANSAPVVVASDQSAVPVSGTFWQATQPVSGTIAATQSGTWNLTNISGTISLPTGAATETTLSTLNGKIPSNLTVSATRLLVDGSGVTQPISGTISATQSGTWNVGLNAGSNAIGSITNTSFASTQSGVWTVGLSAGTNYIGKTRLTDGTTDAEVIPLAGYNAQAVAIVDGSGNQLTSFPVTNTGTFAVQAAQSGTWNITNISGTVSLPTGAATAAKQPALGTAGTASADVITVQGIASMTALKVDGSDVTQPVSGTVTANAGTGTFAVSGTVAATQSGTWNVGLNAGTNYAGKIRLTDGTTDAEVVPLTGYNAQAVAIVDGSGNQVTSFGGGTQYTEGTAVASPTGTLSLGYDGTNVQALSTTAAGLLNIADGGGSITIDGTVTANAGTGSFTVAQATAANLNATVVGTGTFAVQAAQSGTWNIGTLTSITNTVTVSGTVTASNTAGDVASGSVDSGNPVKIGHIVRQTLPASNPTSDRIDSIADRYGRQLIGHIDAGMQIWKQGEYSTTQTGTNIWTPTAGNRFVITQLHITAAATTAGTVTIWGAATGTTAYAAGTDQVFFKGDMAPSTTSRPVILVQPPVPFFSDTTNDCLKITTSANMTVYVQVYGYEITP